MTVVRCGRCGVTLDEPADTPVVARTPCAVCGSTRRLRAFAAGGVLDPKGDRAYKAKRGGVGRPFAWGKVGSEFYWREARWTRRERHFNRETDTYYEHITDAETREVRQHTEEPLSAHQAHGDAKRHAGPARESTRGGGHYDQDRRARTTPPVVAGGIDAPACACPAAEIITVSTQTLYTDKVAHGGETISMTVPAPTAPAGYRMYQVEVTLTIGAIVDHGKALVTGKPIITLSSSPNGLSNTGADIGPEGGSYTFVHQIQDGVQLFVSVSLPGVPNDLYRDFTLILAWTAASFPG